TLAVVRQFRARGRVTSTLLGIVALDDAVAVLIFALVTTSYENIGGGGLILSSLWGPGLEITGSLLLGILLGFGTVLLRRTLHSWEDNLLYGIALACLAGGLASQLGLSVILTTMTAGATAVNFGAKSMFRALDDIQIPIFVIFFGLAGAKLDIASVPYIGLVGGGYILARVLGKITGAWLGATLAAAPRVVRQYTGIALLPQAGVAIGLALMAARIAPEFENEILTIMIASTVIFELVGPACTGVALCWAGESSDRRDGSCELRESAATPVED
ncbi:MAG: cation:proton antiporter, partial [Clostridia bacterium]